MERHRLANIVRIKKGKTTEMENGDGKARRRFIILYEINDGGRPAHARARAPFPSRMLAELTRRCP